MSTTPTPVRRPLTDAERDLVSHLLIWKLRDSISRQHGIAVTIESVVDTLKGLIEHSGMVRTYDTRNVYVLVGERQTAILRVGREWLAFNALHDERLTEDQLREAVSEGVLA